VLGRKKKPEQRQEPPRPCGPDGYEQPWRVPVTDDDAYRWLLKQLGVSGEHVVAQLRKDAKAVRDLEIKWAIKAVESGARYASLGPLGVHPAERDRAREILRLNALNADDQA